MFGPEVAQAAQAHALQEYPKESCGLVIGGVYRPVQNVSVKPTEQFMMTENDWPLDETIQAVIHSHTRDLILTDPHDNPQCPSGDDIRYQMETTGSDVPWGIIWAQKEVASHILWFGDHVLDEPLYDEKGQHIAREFVHGVRDCFTIVRKYFWQERGVKLQDVPRDIYWWNDGANLYLEGFEGAGFRVIGLGPAVPSNVRPGDVVLMRTRSRVPNHAGVILHNELMLHHLWGQVSRREPINRWLNLVTHWLRYEV